MELIKSRISVLEEKLGNVAGIDPLEDRYTAGAIAGYKDLLNIQFDEVEQ